MSKRPEYQIAPDTSGRHYWRSLKEYEGDPKLVQLKPAEFEPGITDEPDEMSRRTFFNLMGAATAMAGLAACRRPEEKIVPFASAPRNFSCTACAASTLSSCRCSGCRCNHLPPSRAARTGAAGVQASSCVGAAPRATTAGRWCSGARP